MKRLLIRTLKVIGWSMAVIVLVPMLGFLYYDVTEFQPRRDDIAKLVADAHPAEQRPPQMLRRLLMTESRDDLSIMTSYVLRYRLEVPDMGHLLPGWHATVTFWWLLAKLHLSEDEQLAIICGQSFLGRRSYGFEAGAQTYFQRPLYRLTDAELATLVVFARRPNWWENPKSRDAILRSRDSLLEHARSGVPFPPCC